MRTSITRRWVKVAVPFVTLALVAAACGGDDDDAASDTTTAEGTTPAATDAPEATTAATDAPEATTAATDAPEATEPVVPAEILTDFGVTDDTIRIGLNADLSGPFRTLVSEIVAGQEAYWEIVNENGGIAGRQVELVVKDNAYDVPTHLANYEEMAAESDEGVVMFSQSTGSPHTAATADALVDDDLLAIPLSWYSGWPDPAIGENVLELYTNYCLESMNGMTYLAGAQNPSTVAIISLPGEYGQDGATGAKAAAEALGLEIVYDGEGAVVSGADQTPVITELVNAQPDLVWATITPGTLGEIMGGAYAQGLRAQWSGNSPTYDFHLLATDLAPILDELYTQSAYTQLWNSDDSPGMTEVVEGMRAQKPDAPVSDVYVIAWTEGYATQQILEKAAANGDMTRAGIVAAAKDPTLEIDFHGLSPNQTFGGDPNDFIVRESYMYDIDISKYTPDGTVSDPEAATGGVLLTDGPFVSDTAADYEFEGACFVPAG
jgi:ABC-type branched-subunit amino acid transport system substrate-binding protein